MINQIITWWVNHFSLQLGDNPRAENLILLSLGINNIAFCEWILAEYLGFSDPKYTLINALIIIVTMAFSLRIVSQIYINTGNAIAQRCDSISTKLLHYYGLQPNSEMNGFLLDYIIFILIGGATGIFLIGTASYYSLRFMGLPETIDAMICYTPAMLLGGVPGCVFGFAAGRLVDHAPEIIRSYQQARAIITLNDLPSNVDQHRYLPPEILGIIYSYLIRTSEQASTRIINEVIDESNNNICSLVNNKISFFASRYRQPRQLIEDIEDEFESTLLLPMYRVQNL